MTVRVLKARNGYRLTMAELHGGGEIIRGYSVIDAPGETYYAGPDLSQAEHVFKELADKAHD